MSATPLTAGLADIAVHSGPSNAAQRATQLRVTSPHATSPRVTRRRPTGVPRLLLALAAIVVLAGCGGPETQDPRTTREADAVGAVVSIATTGGGLQVTFSPDPGYEYFDGTVFDFEKSGDLLTASGEPAGAADLEVGDSIEVWVEACAESFPVQCGAPVGRILP